MEEIFRQDAYARTCEATVVAADGSGIRLDRTVFYPMGGGQPGDRGRLRLGGGEKCTWVVRSSIGSGIGSSASRPETEELDTPPRLGASTVPRATRRVVAVRRMRSDSSNTSGCFVLAH